MATILSFAGILWTLSGSWQLRLFGADFRIPGFMMWVALLYAGGASWLSHRVGRRLVPISFDQKHYEADFRYGLVRFRNRALLHRPDWLFLDEATSGLDEAMEEHVYELLEERLPDAAVISIAHRPGVVQYHDHVWTIEVRAGVGTVSIAADSRPALPGRDG